MLLVHRFVGSLFSWSLAVLALSACSGAQDPPPSPGNAPTADEANAVAGVADKGAHPAVVVLSIGGSAFCSATLVAPDVVLTARHCVSSTADKIACPPAGPQVTSDRAPGELSVLVGESVATASERARGVELVLPPGDAICGADLALVVLDQPIDGVEPIAVRGTGIAKGDHVTSVGFGKATDGAAPGEKLVRDHVKVLDETLEEFVVGEATCQGDSGGPALDEQSGEIVGVVSRGGPTCSGAGVHNIYTRTDPFLSLIEDAIGRGGPIGQADASSEAGKKPRASRKDGGRPKGAGKHTDLGASCQVAADCAAGVCVTDAGKQYCSRPCDAKDRCPAHFRCALTAGSSTVCLEH